MSENQIHQDILDLYADLSASFLALATALENAGIVSKAQIAEAAQERLLAVQPFGMPHPDAPCPFLLLRTLAVGLKGAST